MLPFLLVKKRLVKEKYIILYIRQFFERSSRKLKKEDAYKLGVGQTRFRKKFRRKQWLRKFRGFLLWTAGTIAATAGVCSLFFNFSFCVDDGMAGYINRGELVVTDRLSAMIREPLRGEAITCRINAGGSEKILQRRIIAFGGETVEIRDGVLYIDGKACTEPYASGILQSDISSFSIPPGNYFCLSDNRDCGPDSRDGFFITRDDIIGPTVQGISVQTAADGINNVVVYINEIIGNFT